MNQRCFSHTLFKHVGAFLLLLFSAPLVFAQETLPVVVHEASEGPIFRQLQVQGTVTSAQATQLSAATSGQVSTVAVDAGVRVKTGDVLVVLDYELASLELAGASARVDQAKQGLSDAKRRLQEARRLAPQQSISESAVLDIEAEVANDEAILRESVAEAELRRATLARHTVKAPFDGVIAEKLTESGEWVTPGQAIVTLVSTARLRLDFRVAEDYLELVGPETEVAYQIGPNDLWHKGSFATAVPIANRDDRTFLLRVNPVENHPALAPGRSVTAKLKIPTGRIGLAVPRDALLRYPDGRTIAWIVDNTGEGLRAKEVVVKTGLQFDSQVEILEGLPTGSKVIVQGNESLRPGRAIVVQNAKDTKASR
ncbi:MAG: efflux RND transporter periplasmic adaptor subunit [Halieaceae bacterium]